MYKNPGKRRTVVRNYRRRKRQDALRRMGGKCVRCGYSDWRALQVDHVGGWGTKERKTFKDTYTYLKFVLQDKTGKYQILCANCNWIKRYEQYEERKTLN